MNQLLIYSKVWFTVVDNRPASPCYQMNNFWHFRTLEAALKKLEELGKNYYTRDYSMKYPKDLEPIYYSNEETNTELQSHRISRARGEDKADHL